MSKLDIPKGRGIEGLTPWKRYSDHERVVGVRLAEDAMRRQEVVPGEYPFGLSFRSKLMLHEGATYLVRLELPDGKVIAAELDAAIAYLADPRNPANIARRKQEGEQAIARRAAFMDEYLRAVFIVACRAPEADRDAVMKHGPAIAAAVRKITARVYAHLAPDHLAAQVAKIDYSLPAGTVTDINDARRQREMGNQRETSPEQADGDPIVTLESRRS
jgi:hypothetical protein